MGPGVPPLPWPPTSEGRSRARGAGLAPCPQGRTAGLKTTLPRGSRGPGLRKRRARPISAARLSASRRLHLRPITSWSTRGLTEGRTHLGTGFPLRCFQRLSQPDSATGRCRWSTTRAPEVRPPRSSRTRVASLSSPTPAEDRDRTVSRRSEPSSRTSLMGLPIVRLDKRDILGEHLRRLGRAGDEVIPHDGGDEGV